MSKNIKTNKFTVKQPKRRSGLAVAAMERGIKIVPDKTKIADKKACRRWRNGDGKDS